MPKKKAADPESELDPAGPSLDRMDVKISGPAAEVRKQLGLHKPPGNGDLHHEDPPSDINRKFFALLSDPKYVAVVKRTFPRFVGDVKTDIQVAEFDLPTGWKDIADEVAKSHGGRKYRVAIVNPATSETMAAERMTIDADPIVQPDPGADDFLGNLGEQNEPDPMDQIDEVLDKDLRASAKQLQIEAAKRRISELRGESPRPRGASTDPESAALRGQVEDLKRKLDEDRRGSELRAIEDRHNREMAELKRLLVESQKPRHDPLMEMLIADRKAADDKFAKLLDMMASQRQDALMAELRELKNKREDGGFEKQLELFKMFADIAGIDLPGKGGGDDDEEKEWYEVLVEKHLPRVLDMIDSRKKGGNPVSKEELIREIDKAADRAAIEATAAVKARAAAQLPGPPKPQVPTAQAAPMQPPAEDVPLPPPAGAPAGSPSLQRVAPNLPTVEEERVTRCAGVLSVLDRECLFRPKLVQWNYSAWQNLPDDMLERFSTAADLGSALSVFDGAVNAEQLAKLKEKVASDERTKAWATAAYRELREWWAESLNDPAFDPEESGDPAEED